MAAGKCKQTHLFINLISIYQNLFCHYRLKRTGALLKNRYSFVSLNNFAAFMATFPRYHEVPTV